MDFLGKVRKHSKNNIKIASNRSNFLFSSLPDDIKIVLGDEFNEELWNKIKDSGTLPAYLSELEIEEETIDEFLNRLGDEINEDKETQEYGEGILVGRVGRNPKRLH